MTKKELKQINNIEQKQRYFIGVLEQSRYDEDEYEFALHEYLLLEEQKMRLMNKLG